MKKILLIICLASLMESGFIQIFPTASMNGNDYIYRSFYLSQGVAELALSFQAGSYGRTNLYITFGFPKSTYSYIEGTYKENTTLPKSLGVDTTIFLKNNTNDSSVWNLEESTRYRKIVFYPSKNYFIFNGQESNRLDANGVPCKSYTIYIQFLLQGTEFAKLVNLGKLIGIVTLLFPNSTNGSTQTQVGLLNSIQNTFNLNTNISTSFSTCKTETDCSESPGLYRLNEDAIFRLIIKGEAYNAYFLRNLIVTMAKDSDPSLDVTSLITILSSSNKVGEVIFKLPIIMIPQNYLTISIQASLISSASRIMASEDQNSGVIDFTIVKINNEIKDQTDVNTNYLVSLFAAILFIILFL